MTDTELRSPAISVPTPDPTALTRESIDRDIGALKELIFVRLNAMDEAIRVAKADLVRVPTDVDKQVVFNDTATTEKFLTMEEKFAGVQQQFRERDTRVKDAAEASDAALKAALAAAKEQAGDQVKSLKESIDKSEAATTKQIDTQGTSINTATAGLERQIGDLKERLTRLESLGIGRSEATVDLRAWFLAGLTTILFVIAIAAYITK